MCKYSHYYNRSGKNQLDELVVSELLHLQVNWANPLSTRAVNSALTAGLLPPGSNPSRIDVVGTSSYLKIEKDSVFAQLPFFGERQFGGAFNTQEVGIQFEGIPEDLTMSFDEKKQRYEFEFDIINEHGEGFNINGIIYPNLTTSFYINSTERSTIGYWGRVEETAGE